MYTVSMFRLLAAFVCMSVIYRQAEAVNCHLRELDLCLATILISASDGVPGDDEEIDRACEPIQEGFECIGNYTESCFTAPLQELFNMVVEEPRKAQQKFCTQGSEERAKYLKHAPCFQDVLSNENLKVHMEDMMAALEKATEAKFDERIPILCCGVQRLFGVSLDLVKDKCGEEVLDEAGAMVGISINNISSMFCRGYERESDKCKALLPPAGTTFKGVDSDNQLIRFIASAMASFA